MQKQRINGQNQKTDRRIAWPIIIVSFTGVYNYEAFVRNNKPIWLDRRHLHDTGDYCDREGALALKGTITDYPTEGVHFIDSGNYRHLTKFWTDKFETPFSLIVFDHYPDMQPPLFDNIFSYGSWIKDVLDHNNDRKKVITIGSSDKLIQAILKGYERQVRFYSEATLMHEGGWQSFSSGYTNRPVYISTDKDTLDPASIATNQGQGPFSLQELKKLLTVILQKEQVIGIDICREYFTTLSLFEEKWKTVMDNQANEELLKFIRSSSDLQQNQFFCYYNCHIKIKQFSFTETIARRTGSVAHDVMKRDVIERVLWNSERLIGHGLYYVGTAGVLIKKALEEKYPEIRWDITILKSGPLGDDQQIGSRTVEGEIDYLFFFIDPMTLQPHDTDVKALARPAGVESIILCCNCSTVDHVIMSPLFTGPTYERIHPDYTNCTQHLRNRGIISEAVE